MKIPIHHLKAGMMPRQTLYAENGAILVTDGVPLTDKIIERLKKLNLPAISICENCTVDIAKETWTAEANEIFRMVSLSRIADTVQAVIAAAMSYRDVKAFWPAIDSNRKLRQHSLRTALLSVAIGITQQYDSQNLGLLAAAALLHDLGIERMAAGEKEHSLQGFRTLWSGGADITVCLVCLQHHEQMDGTGEPLGLKRSQIIEFARMVSIADTYDKLVNFKDHTAKQAVFKIFGLRGNALDPQLVSLFEQLVTKKELFQPVTN